MCYWQGRGRDSFFTTFPTLHCYTAQDVRTIFNNIPPSNTFFILHEERMRMRILISTNFTCGRTCGLVECNSAFLATETRERNFRDCKFHWEVSNLFAQLTFHVYALARVILCYETMVVRYISSFEKDSTWRVYALSFAPSPTLHLLSSFSRNSNSNGESCEPIIPLPQHVDARDVCTLSVPLSSCLFLPLSLSLPLCVFYSLYHHHPCDVTPHNCR